MVAHNTNYYRRNKARRFKVHTCPHCTFETTGPKSSLQAHIWAKHTEEKDRPFQCPCKKCNRGYSARANLHKHIKKFHNITIPLDKDIYAYVVKTKDICKKVLTQKELTRYKVYKNNVVLPRKFQEISQHLSLEALYFDVHNKLITIKGYTKKEILELKNN